jgi:hypothetical protein
MLSTKMAIEWWKKKTAAANASKPFKREEPSRV